MNRHTYMKKYLHDAFISYATEDEKYAKKLANALEYQGFSVWFAPLSLKIGDKLLDSINDGMNSSMCAVLLLSPAYVSKKWPNYETDVLLRQHIEMEKKLLPLWHNITKKEIEKWNPGLSGTIALNSTLDVSEVAEKISKVISKNSPIVGVTPRYENPEFRFFQGRGELLVNSIHGPAFNIFEAAEFPDNHFPFYIHGTHYSRKDIIISLTKVMYYNSHDDMRVNSEQWKRLLKLCKGFGYDIEAPYFDAATIG